MELISTQFLFSISFQSSFYVAWKLYLIHWGLTTNTLEKKNYAIHVINVKYTWTLIWKWGLKITAVSINYFSTPPWRQGPFLKRWTLGGARAFQLDPVSHGALLTFWAGSSLLGGAVLCIVGSPVSNRCQTAASPRPVSTTKKCLRILSNIPWGCKTALGWEPLN